MTLARILCPTDFSAVSTQAEAYAVALARHYGATLHLLHVDPPIPLLAPYGEIPVDLCLFDEQRTQAETSLTLAAARATGAGVTVETTLRGGNASREVLAMLAEQPADLLVIGTHGRSGVEHLLLGSVAETLVRKAPCAVMVVPAAAAPGVDAAFSRILCPVDGSSGSAEAVAFALSLARETDGAVTLLSVVDPPPLSGEFGAIDADGYRQLAHTLARALLTEAVPAEVRAWCHITETIAEGKPSTRIVEAAACADVIVMGVRGRGALDLMAFGSTTNDVLRRAICPVVAVHPRAPERFDALPALAHVV